MHQEKPKQHVKTLSIRIPRELYLTVSQYTIDKDLPSLNATIISLINSGLNAVQERENAISQFILEIIPKEKLEKLIDGQ